MLRENERLYNNILALLDIFLSLIAFFTSYYYHVYSVTNEKVISYQYFLLGILIIPTWYILLKIISIQSSQRIKAYSVVLIEYSLVLLVGISFLFIFIFIFKLNYISRITILIFGLSNIILLFVSRVIIISFAKRSRIKGRNISNVIIVADDSSINFIEKIISEKHWGLNIFGLFSNSDEIIKKYSEKLLIINTEEKLDNIMEQQIIDKIIYSKNEIDYLQIQNLIYSCGEIGVTFQLQSDFFNIIASKSQLYYFGELPMITFETTSSDYFALTIKSIIDYFFSFFAILFFLPFLIIISIFIKAESKGSVFFKQKRIGLHGRPFTMYKFRTMVQNAEEIKKELINKNEVEGPVFKIKKDPRITKTGAFLRKTSLDEFPQFLNVLQGDMSVVGPRPPIPEEVALYKRPQLRRLSMKPGITCIWQASDRNKTSFEEWIKLDLQYIDNWSLKLDIILILKTINSIYKKTGY